MTAETFAFFDLEGMSLTDHQVSCARGVEGLLAEADPPFLDPHSCAATVIDAGYLSLEMGHRLVPRVKAAVEISPEGEVLVSCAAAHPGFALRFNSRWEPEDSFGDLPEALDILRALLEGRIESEVWWTPDRDGEAKSVDFMIAADGSRTKLYSQYHGEGMVSAFGRQDCERRRVTFIEPEAIEVSACAERASAGEGLAARIRHGVRRWTGG